MTAFALCLLLALDPTTTGNEVVSGCGYAQPIVTAAEQYGLNPRLLVAIARRETSIHAATNSSGHCGPWQVHPAWADGFSCADLQGPIGAWAGAFVLRDKLRASHGNLKEALRRYSGSRKGSTWYARQVLNLIPKEA